ncbi:MAG TPA: DMT family transporter [Gammaproteobacteria bacterium]|nr:DMT family transporter [Gammaproteobacteria bacterium]
MSHAHQAHPIRGALLKLVSVLFLASMAACVKYLGAAIPSGETVFVRGLISLVVLAFIAWRVEGLHLLKTANLRSHALRSLSGTASMFCWFTALTLIPLADFTAITFTAPMFLTVLAMLFLGERIHAYRWTALGVGFAGVLIMVGPHLSFGGGSLGVGLSLGAAVFSAVAMMFLRSMSGSGGEHAITITFYFSMTSMIVAAFTAVAGWPMPTAEQWTFIVLIGVLGVFGQLLMTWSYRYAEASMIAPLDYANLLFAVLYGYFFFGETPYVSVWIGAPLVIAAGLIILWREYRASQARAGPVVVPNALAEGHREIP